jgi:6-phosphogluconolactonase
LAMAAADMFADHARTCISERGSFAVAISGGSTPRAMNKLLASELYHDTMPWDKTHIFWVDERCVPEDDRASNYGNAKTDFINLVPIPKDNVHPLPVNVPPEEGKRRYEHELREFFQLTKAMFPVFDMMFLGMGRDGHTASLFPGQTSLSENKQLILIVKGGEPDVSRLTMTFPVLNNSRQTVILVSGKEKAAVMKRVFSNRSDSGHLPIQMVQPRRSELIWMLDRDAASLISE